MIFFAVKEIEVDDIYRNALVQRAVHISAFKLTAVQLRQVVERTVLVIALVLYLHFNVYQSAIGFHTNIHTAVFLGYAVRHYLGIEYNEVFYRIIRYAERIR